MPSTRRALNCKRPYDANASTRRWPPQVGIGKEEVALRERHLKDLRDRIVSAKRLGREEQASKVEAAGQTAAPRTASPASHTQRTESVDGNRGNRKTYYRKSGLSAFAHNTVNSRGRKIFSFLKLQGANIFVRKKHSYCSVNVWNIRMCLSIRTARYFYSDAEWFLWTTEIPAVHSYLRN